LNRNNLLILILLIALGVKGVQYIMSKPTYVRPYPYQFQDNQPIELKNNPQVLVIGDRMADRFMQFSDTLSSVLSADLKNPIIIESLAGEFEGLHRTLHKLKRIKKLPKVIIYHGASVEFFEKKYRLSEVEAILTNLHRYKDPTYQSFLYIAPQLSRFIFKKVKQLPLDSLVKPVGAELSQVDIMKLSELEYELYRLQLDDLIKYVKKRNSLLILMTTPINIELPPRMNCPTVDTNSIRSDLAVIKNQIEQKDYKGAYEALKKIEDNAPGFSEFFYLKGKIQKELQEFNLAKRTLEVATSFDCEKWRPDPVFNHLIKEAASKNQIFIYDF
jgi:hypothetical protein